jgi:hypothetical protein
MLSNPGRLCASVEDTSDLFELEGHGFETNDVLLFRAEDGGSMPTPLVAGVPYYAIRISESTFKVSLTAGGEPVNLTVDGASVVVSIALPVDEILEYYSRFVDDVIPAHLVPLTAPYPTTVVVAVATLAAKRLLYIAQQSSESMDALELGERAKLERWAAHVPIRDPRVTSSANLSVSEGSTADPRKWGIGGILP